MKTIKLTWGLMGLAVLMCTACGESSDKSVDTSSDSDTAVCQSAKMTILDLNFDDGQGAGSRLTMARPAADTDGTQVVTLDSYPDTATTAATADMVDTTNVSTDTPATDTGTGTIADMATDSAMDTGSDTATGDIATDTPVDTATVTTIDTATVTADDTAAEAMTYYIFPDNNTSVEWKGHPGALKIHADAQDDSGYGKSVEIQLALDAPVNMTCEDYVVTFDIWTPSALVNAGGNAQFAFLDVASNTPIYSHWFEVKSNQWTTVTGKVTAVGGAIDYSEFTRNPEDWVVDAFRLKIIADSATEGQEFVYYVDNIKVTNIGTETADTATN